MVLKRSALVATALFFVVPDAANAEGFAIKCGKLLHKEILKSNADIKPGYSSGGRFTMGRDGFGVERGIEGLKIYAKWHENKEWLECTGAKSVNCGSMFNISGSHLRALDGVGPDPGNPGYSSLTVISQVNQMTAQAKLINASLIKCEYLRDASIVRGNIPGYGSMTGRRYPIAFGWTATYEIEGVGKRFDIGYAYNGLTTWFHEKPIF